MQQDVDGKATDYALGWSVALGSPYTFETTLESEYQSDIFGERGILLGAVHGIAESLYRALRRPGHEPRTTPILNTSESITGPISKTISRSGLKAVYEQLDDAGEGGLPQGLQRRLPSAAREVLEEIYDDVASGNEVRSVIQADAPPRHLPDGQDRRHRHVGGRREGARQRRAQLCADQSRARPASTSPAMMAQVDLLKDRGHPYSEIANESIIEAVDSLQSLHGLHGRVLHGRQLLDHRPARAPASGRRASTTS